MPATISVILQSDVEKLGKSGELVKVRPGYARNFLLPRELAVVATSAAINRINHERAVALAKAEKAKKEARDLASKLEGLEVSISRTAGEEDRLFGSVSTKDIQAALKAKGFDIDRKKMHLADTLKTLGTFDVPIKLLTDVTATIKVSVTKK